MNQLESPETSKGKARKQQFVRLYDEEESILARWQEKYTTSLSKPDFSSLVRHCIRLSKQHLDDE